MPKVISLFQPLMFEHKSSASTTAETELKNQWSSLPHPDTNNCSISLLLICVNLMFVMLCYNKLLVKHATQLKFPRPTRDGRPFASSPFRRLASRGPFFLCCILIWWPLLLVVYLCRRLSLHDQVPRKREIAHTQCTRPHDTLTCYLDTATWLGNCQSILTQTQHSSELSTVCCRASPLCPSTCLPVGLVPLGWPLAPPGGPVRPGHSPSQ